MLSGAQKKSGVNTWRYVFTGVENTTGQERRFFIELSMLNPFLSPSEPVLGYKNRVKIQPEDLQNVLAGTISAQKLETENKILFDESLISGDIPNQDKAGYLPVILNLCSQLFLFHSPE